MDVAADAIWCRTPEMLTRTYADGVAGESMALALRFNEGVMMVESGVQSVSSCRTPPAWGCFVLT
jgi:hypothetical protein